ncbi:PepSY-associated TM helix domain-containing protein [Achromobacter insuavis]
MALLRRLHRWAGLFLALFLFVSGLTGAIISWDHELDEWLNPQLFDAPAAAGATPRSALALADGLEAADPRLRVAYLPLAVEPGHALGVSVVPRIDPATGRPYPLDFNQVTLDPATGAVRGAREWGRVSLARENLMPFLYKLHYTLHLPDIGRVELGTWFMGIVAIVWALDSLIALAISFPSRKAWRKSLSFRLRQGRPKLVFDLHRSGGVGVGPAADGRGDVGVDEPGTRSGAAAGGVFSPLTPDIFALRRPAPPAAFQEPGITRGQALEIGRAQARQRGWTLPAVPCSTARPMACMA